MHMASGESGRLVERWRLHQVQEDVQSRQYLEARHGSWTEAHGPESVCMVTVDGDAGTDDT